jgi:hypothetical protein
VVEGKSNKEIARTLNLGEGTVKVHMAGLFRALGVNTRAGAAVAGTQLLSDGNQRRDIPARREPTRKRKSTSSPLQRVTL